MKRTKQFLILALTMAVLLSTLGFGLQAFASIAETPSRVVSYDWELSEAIQEANSGDTIGIDAYLVFSSGYSWNFGDAEKEVYIKRMNPDARLVFYDSVNFQNITFDGGSLSSSNFIILNCNATLQNCTFQNIGGGAVVCSAGEQTFTNCTFDNCNDGCINVEWGAYKTTFANCTFQNNTNTSGVGGAIRNEGDLTLDSCLMKNNICMVDGGAVFNYHLLTVSNCKIYGNEAEGSASDIASRMNEAEGMGTTFTDDSEALNALFADDGYTVELSSEEITNDDYGSYTRFNFNLTEIPGEDDEPIEDEPGTDEPSEDNPGEEPSTPSEAEPSSPSDAEPSTPSDSGNNNQPSTPTDSGSNQPSNNQPSSSGTSSSSSNPSSDSSNSFRIDEPLGNVENHINIESPNNPTQYPSEIHISGNLGGSDSSKGNMPLQQTINVGSQNSPSEASTESGDKNITLSLNIGDAAELGSAFLLFKAAMLAIIFGVFAMLGIVVITILKKK